MNIYAQIVVKSLNCCAPSPKRTNLQPVNIALQPAADASFRCAPLIPKVGRIRLLVVPAVQVDPARLAINSFACQ